MVQRHILFFLFLAVVSFHCNQHLFFLFFLPLWNSTTLMWIRKCHPSFHQQSGEFWVKYSFKSMILVCFPMCAFSSRHKHDTGGRIYDEDFISGTPQIFWFVFREVRISSCHGFDQELVAVFAWPPPYGALSVYLCPLGSTRTHAR